MTDRLLIIEADMFLGLLLNCISYEKGVNANMLRPSAYRVRERVQIVLDHNGGDPRLDYSKQLRALEDNVAEMVECRVAELSKSNQVNEKQSGPSSRHKDSKSDIAWAFSGAKKSRSGDSYDEQDQINQLTENIRKGIKVDEYMNSLTERVQRDFRAAVALANLYEEGDAVDQDRKKAFDYYNIAAKEGDAESQYKVGECYRLGMGVSVNEEMARRHYTFASRQGHERAMQELSNLMPGPTKVRMRIDLIM